MKRNSLFLTTALLISLASCKSTPVQEEPWISNALGVASYQLKKTAEELTGTNQIPRSIHSGYDINFLDSQLQHEDKSYIDSLYPNPSAKELLQRYICGIEDWTSGFFPGSLWYAYEMTGDEKLKSRAIQYTNMLNPIRRLKNTHDVGFMINCSYGNALRLAPDDTIKAVIIETADNLSARFNPAIGCIRSWDFGEWNFPVIIDNMMNLELLFHASKVTGDESFRKVAISHAEQVMHHQVRKDYSCFHIIYYDKKTGKPIKGETSQGYSDNSAWSRGQAWGIYGFTMCYRETKDKRFLKTAEKMADFYLDHPNLPSDKVAWWDFNAFQEGYTPGIRSNACKMVNNYRDASAAACVASALLELSTYSKGSKSKKYLESAKQILHALGSTNYRAELGKNANFILMHSVGAVPHNSEIDVPLTYADYYFIEALHRYNRMLDGKSPL